LRCGPELTESGTTPIRAEAIRGFKAALSIPSKKSLALVDGHLFMAYQIIIIQDNKAETSFWLSKLAANAALKM
jgi:hypothetical protein